MKVNTLIHFDFICVYGVRKCSSFILLQVVDQISQHHLLKRLSLIHCIFLLPLSKIRCPYVRGFISGLSILFHWSIFLSLCQYHTVLITVAYEHPVITAQFVEKTVFSHWIIFILLSYLTIYVGSVFGVPVHFIVNITLSYLLDFISKSLNQMI